MFIRPEDDIRRTRFTVAVDFDGVIHRRTTKSNILALDEPMPGAATALKMLRQEGVWIIIHTARPLAEGDNLRESAAKIPERIGGCLPLSKQEAATLYRLLYQVLHGIE